MAFEYKFQKCRLSRMIDGDTYTISVDLGFGCSIMMTCRLNGTDCPEYFKSTCKEEKRLALAAMSFVNSEIDCKDLNIHSRMKDKYGRYVIDISYEKSDVLGTTTLSLSEELAKSGHLKRESYCDKCLEYQSCTNKIKV
jgi:endonuclease YncB( thermonuclease family)